MRDTRGRRASRRCGSPPATATTLITRAADLRAGPGRRARRGARRRARAPRAGPAPWPRSRALASPVAGAFVALAAAAWWLERPRWWPVALAAGALGPAVALAVAFPEGGSFPFVASSFWPALAAALAVGLVIPRERARGAHRDRALRRWRSSRASCWRRRWAATSVRLGALFAGPRARRPRVAHEPPRRSSLLALPLLYWQWIAPIDDWARAAGDAVRARALLRRRCCASWAPATAARSAWRSRSPTTTGRRAGSRRTCRWPAAGSASSTASATRSSTTASDHRPRATAAGSTTTRCASSRCADAPLDYSAAREAAARARRRALPARGLARRPLARLRGRRRPPLAGGAARVTAIDAGRVRLAADRAGRGRPARALHAVLADRDRARLRRAGPAAGRGCASSAPGRCARRAFALGRVRATAPRCTDERTPQRTLRSC